MYENLYTVDQISIMLSIHPKTVQRYIREGKLHAAKVGKGWRISGHDLSTFIEKNSLDKPSPESRSERASVASSVIDVQAEGKDDAVRVMNTLTAALNAKPSEYGQSSMQSQYIEREHMVRITLWGGIRFMAIMMDTIATLVEQNDEE